MLEFGFCYTNNGRMTTARGCRRVDGIRLERGFGEYTLRGIENSELKSGQNVIEKCNALGIDVGDTYDLFVRVVM